MRKREVWRRSGWAILCTALNLSLAAQISAPSSAGTGAAATIVEPLPQKEARLRGYLLTHPTSAEEQYQLAYTLFQEHRMKDSLLEYTRAARLRTPAAGDLETVALDYVLLNDYADADRWMTASVSAGPGRGGAWYELGRIKYTENRFAEAVAAFQKALALTPESVRATDNLGLALEGLGRTAEAEAAYRKAIALQQSSTKRSEQPMLNLAILLSNQGQPEQALGLLQEAVRIDPGNCKIHEQLGRAYERLGRLPDAEGSLKQAVALSPETSALHFQLGQVYRKEGKQVEAKAEFDRVAVLRGTKSDSAK